MAGFNLPVDLSDADVKQGGVTELPPGVYKGTTKSCEMYKGGSSIKFEVEIADVGVIDLYIGTDFEKKGNRNSLLTCLASHGKNIDKIKAAGKSFQFSPDFVVGKPCFVISREVAGTDDQGRPKLNDKSFLPPDRYEALKNVKPQAAVAKPAGNAGAATAAAGAQPAAPAGTAGAALFD